MHPVVRGLGSHERRPMVQGSKLACPLQSASSPPPFLMRQAPFTGEAQENWAPDPIRDRITPSLIRTTPCTLCRPPAAGVAAATISHAWVVGPAWRCNMQTAHLGSCRIRTTPTNRLRPSPPERAAAGKACIRWSASNMRNGMLPVSTCLEPGLERAPESERHDSGRRPLGGTDRRQGPWHECQHPFVDEPDDRLVAAPRRVP